MEGLFRFLIPLPFPFPFPFFLPSFQSMEHILHELKMSITAEESNPTETAMRRRALVGDGGSALPVTARALVKRMVVEFLEMQRDSLGCFFTKDGKLAAIAVAAEKAAEAEDGEELELGVAEQAALEAAYDHGDEEEAEEDAW